MRGTVRPIQRYAAAGGPRRATAGRDRGSARARRTWHADHWTAPTERVEATRVGRLTGAAVGAYETVLAELDRDLAPIAWLTASELAPGRYHAFVEGHPL
jgi:hypothetical protein